MWLFLDTVKAGGMRVVTKHKHEETDPDAYDQKYVDSLPEPQWVYIYIKSDMYVLVIMVIPLHLPKILPNMPTSMSFVQTMHLS